MKKIIVLFTILFVACHAFAQEKISGYVEDSLTHNRLANVSVTLLRNGNIPMTAIRPARRERRFGRRGISS